MIIRLLIGINKNKKFHDKNLVILSVMKKFNSDYRKFFVGVDLCGDQNGAFKDFVNYKYIINEYKSIGYGVTIHLYETKVFELTF